jgi:acyl dehydratase
MTDRGGPYFDDLEVGQQFLDAPPMTLTEGHAAVHQSIIGDRLRLPLDAPLSERIVGGRAAHPALVWNVAIGQSTLVTQNVKANLFYRGLVFHRMPLIGDTLRTTTTVVGLRENTRRPGRAPTGLAALRMVTVDHAERPVLDFHRCAMLPLREGIAPTGRDDDLDSIGADIDESRLLEAVDGWRLEALERAGASDLVEGAQFRVIGGDVVSSAPELARLTLNIAAVHHDSATAGGQRLVYGGHAIALALAQVSRAIPSVVTVLAWHSCDHTGPVHEGDTLRSTVTVERVVPTRAGASVAHLRSVVTADAENESRQVLDWRFVALVKS